MLPRRVVVFGFIRSHLVTRPFSTTMPCARGFDSDDDAGSVPQPHRQELHIYDFDGTLFRSVCPSPALQDKNDFMKKLQAPNYAEGLGWFQAPQLLQPPYVPQQPPRDSNEWYVMDVVEKARKSKADGHYVVVLTGRESGSFARRIQELLRNGGVPFDEFHAKPRPKLGTVKAKVDQIAEIVQKVNPPRIVMYDDREEQAQRIKAGVEQLFPQTPVELHMVSGNDSYLTAAQENDVLWELHAAAEVAMAREAQLREHRERHGYGGYRGGSYRGGGPPLTSPTSPP